MMTVPFLVNALMNFAIGLLVARFLGPDEYGQYALAVSLGILMQTMGFDWLRLCATRYYSDDSRLVRPEIRSTLNALFAIVVGVGILAAVAIAMSGIHVALSSGLLALAIAVAVASGLFEFAAALLRARFHNRAYAILVITKNVAAIGLTAGAAWYSGSAKMALVGLVVSIGCSLAVNHATLRDKNAQTSLVDRRLAIRFAAYALPIVMANVLYQGAATSNRAILAHVHGFAQAGQLALAFDLGIRIVGAIGATLDVLLFQVAVRAEATQGAVAARRQIARNMGIIFAVVVPTVAGCWLVLPSFTHLLIPESFHGSFERYFTLVLPAMLCLALTHYCVGPAFQIMHRTLPLIVGGLAAATTNGAAIVLLPRTDDATSFAIAQSLGAAAALVVLVAFLCRLEPMWPRARDVVGTLTATTAMIVAVLPMRGLCPCIVTLASQAVVGASVYAIVAFAFDIAGSREALWGRLESWRRQDASAIAPAGPSS